MNNDTIEKVINFLEINDIDYDIVSQVKSILTFPTNNVIQEVLIFLTVSKVHRIIILNIEDILVTQS